MIRHLAKISAVAASVAATALFNGGKAKAISFDDIQIWAGSGTNRAALVIEWSVPESTNYSSVPIPVADKTLVWGYRFNGTNVHGSDMLSAILAADPKLYITEEFGDFVVGVGYNLNGNGNIGITDGTNTDYFTNGLLSDPTVDVDSAHAINSGDLFWSGLYGVNWETWRETNELGGFYSSPNRGTNAYWTTTDTNYFSTGFHGQWQYSGGIDDKPLADGSWIGLSVAAGEFEPDTNAPYNLHKHAPVSPDGTYVAYVGDTNDFAVQIVSSNNIYSRNTFGQYFYTNVVAVLGRPTLKFINGSSFYGDGTIHRVKIVEPAFWTDPGSNSVITEINGGGQITVNMGRKIYHNPNNPYGIDFNVFGNSFYVATGGQGSGGLISDSTDENFVTFSGSAGAYGHPTTVSVSQDGTNWFTYPYVQALVPDNAYRWDDFNHAWTDEQLNETKPLNPSLNFSSGTTVAGALGQFVGAYGGTGYSLQDSGFPWIQYIRIWAGTSTNETSSGNYTVIDAIGAVNPVVVGDALSITPDNLISGISNLNFQKPDDLSQTLISLNFDSVSTNAKISTVSLHDFSAFAPVVGNVSSAYQLQARSLTDTSAVTLQADVGLRAGDNYSGNGNDLRVFQWSGTNWISQPFTFDSTNNGVVVLGVTNFSAFVVSQIVPPQLNIQSGADGFDFQFTPVANCENILERSTDLVNWAPIATNAPATAQSIQLQDTNAPADKAFYRVRLNLP